MATSLDERTAGRDHEAPPDWTPVAEPERGPVWKVLAIVGRGAVAVAVAALLWALGHETPAVILIVVASLLTAASLLSAAVAGALDRGVAFIQRVAGRGLALLFLGTVQLLVFTPVWLVLRVFRHDPLTRDAAPGSDSFWQPVPRGPAKLYRRPFAYERLPREGRGHDRFPLPRVRAVLGLIALLILLDIGLGAAIDGLRDLRGGDSVDSSGGGLAGQDVPAAAGESWRVQLGAEINSVWDRKRYDPYLGWTLPDRDGRHVNVVDGVRRSYEPRTARIPVTVSFFGGSTMFGLYQRDANTIPSEFAKLAEADGIDLRVVNRGRLAYVNWQEVLLLEQLVSAGDVPDLAVFYDGFNEVLGQFQLGPHSEPTHLEAEQVEQRLGLGQRAPVDADDDESLPGAARRAWADVSLVHRLGRTAGLWAEPGTDPARPTSIWPGDQTKETTRRGALAAAIHGRGVDLTRRLARSYGFETAFFWQPFLYSKRLAPGEQEVLGWLGTDAEAWRAADRAARSRLDPAVADLSGALDGVRRPVMYDFVHTNELGARVVARALYERLRPRLRRLAEERR